MSIEYKVKICAILHIISVFASFIFVFLPLGIIVDGDGPVEVFFGDAMRYIEAEMWLLKYVYCLGFGILIQLNVLMFFAVCRKDLLLPERKKDLFVSSMVMVFGTSLITYIGIEAKKIIRGVVWHLLNRGPSTISVRIGSGGLIALLPDACSIAALLISRHD